MRMKVRIDAEMCQGHQMCAIVAPDLFGADDEGYGITLIDGAIPSELEGDARTAQNSCPERAVIVED
jgi:ferredoxin